MNEQQTFQSKYFLHYQDQHYHAYANNTYYKYDENCKLVKQTQIDFNYVETLDAFNHIAFKYDQKFIGILDGQIFMFNQSQIESIYSNQDIISCGYTIFQNVLVVSNIDNEIGFLLNGCVKFDQKIKGSTYISFIVHNNSLLMFQDHFIRGVDNNTQIEIKIDSQFEFQQVHNKLAIFFSDTKTKLVCLNTFQQLHCHYIKYIRFCNNLVFFTNTLLNQYISCSFDAFIKLFTIIDQNFQDLLMCNTHLYLKYQKFEIIRKQLQQDALIKLNEYQLKNQELMTVQITMHPQLYELQQKLNNVNFLLKYQHHQVMNNYVLESRELQWSISNSSFQNIIKQ